MHAVPVRFIVPCVDVVMRPKFGNCGISMTDTRFGLEALSSIAKG